MYSTNLAWAILMNLNAQCNATKEEHEKYKSAYFEFVGCM